MQLRLVALCSKSTVSWSLLYITVNKTAATDRDITRPEEELSVEVGLLNGVHVGHDDLATFTGQPHHGKVLHQLAANGTCSHLPVTFWVGHWHFNNSFVSKSDRRENYSDNDFIIYCLQFHPFHYLVALCLKMLINENTQVFLGCLPDKTGTLTTFILEVLKLAFPFFKSFKIPDYSAGDFYFQPILPEDCIAHLATRSKQTSHDFTAGWLTRK